MTLGIRQRRNLPIRLEKNLRPIPADNGEEWVPIRLLKCNLEPKLVAVERDASIDVADNEERRNRRDCRSCNK
jgi:hypothetical protein